jgi:uncharacterized membrane protein
MSHIKLDLEKALTERVISQDVYDALSLWNKKETPDTGSRFVQIFSVFGSLVTWLWVILLIAANWDGISDMMKTILMIGSTILIYLIAYYFSYRNTDYPKTGQALFFLGSMFYGAAIMLLGQIYNLWGTFDQALLVWSLWVFPLAYLTRFTSLFLLSLALLYSYIFARLTNSWEFSGFSVANVFILIGLVSLLISRWHISSGYDGLARVLSWTGMLGFLGGLYAYTFRDFWVYGSDIWLSVDTSSHTLLFVGMTLWLIALGVYVRERWRNTHTIDNIDMMVIIWSLLVLGFLLFTSLSITARGGSSYYDRDTYSHTLSSLITNIVYIGLILGLIWIGIRREQWALINISMIFLVIYLFGKYLVFVFESKMDGALVFIWWGIVCLIVTFLVEKIRRRLISNLNH